MVNDGSKIERPDLAVAKFEGERVRLPVHVVERAKHPRLTGRNPIKCWLLAVTPGRFRLIEQPPGAAPDDISRILRQIEEVQAPGDVLDRTDNNARDGIVARLIPCSVSPPEPGWRINFPRAAKELVPETEERSFVFVLIVAGFVELWFPDTLRRALSVPISEILS